MADSLTNTSILAADLQTYFAKKTLKVAEFNTVLKQFGEKVPIPSNSSKTVSFTRYAKYTAPSGTPSQLTEGVTPDAELQTIETVTAVAEQYGKLIRLTDLAELTVKHPAVQEVLRNLGLHEAELYDHLVFNVLKAGTTIKYVGGGSAITDITAANKMSYDEMLDSNALLEDNGAKKFGSDFVLVIAPQVKADLLDDADFKSANQFNNTNRIYRGEIGQLAGFRVVSTNGPAFTPELQATSGDANKVYTSFAIGTGAYQISDLQNMRVYNTAPGGQGDPLHQKRFLGYKFAFKSVITNQSWIQVIKSAGRNSVTNP